VVKKGGIVIERQSLVVKLLQKETVRSRKGHIFYGSAVEERKRAVKMVQKWQTAR